MRATKRSIFLSAPSSRLSRLCALPRIARRFAPRNLPLLECKNFKGAPLKRAFVFGGQADRRQVRLMVTPLTLEKVQLLRLQGGAEAAH